MALSSTQIKKRLRDKGSNMSKVAKVAGVSHTTVWKQVHKIPAAKSTRVQDIIAETIDMEREDVFGEVA